MKQSNRIVVGIIALAVVAFGIWWATKGSDTGATSASEILQVHNGGDPASLDPHKVSGDWENRIVGELFEGLMVEDSKGRAIPGMASSYDVSADGTVYTFKLRDAKWSDGTEVTANDFEFAFKRLMDPATAAKYAYLQFTIKNAEAINAGEIEDLNSLGVKAIDAKTLEITLTQPVPFFISALTHYTAYPVPTHTVTEFGDNWVKPANFVGNGAYTVKEWVPGSHVAVIANDQHYYYDQLKIKEAVFHVLEDSSAALKRFEAGEFDIATDFPTDQISRIRNDMPDSLRISPQAGLYYYVLNSNEPFLADQRVRQALSMSIDRDVITQQITGTGEISAYSWVPPGMDNYGASYNASWGSLAYADKLNQAKALMEELGYNANNRLELVLRYNTSENHKRIAVAISGMWKEIYVDVELFNTEVKVHYEDLNANSFEAARAGWLADYNDPSNFLDLLKGGNLYNYGRWESAEFDRLLAKGHATTDLEERAEILYEAEKVAMDESAAIPIYYYVTRNLVAQNIGGFEDNVFDVHRLRYLYKN